MTILQLHDDSGNKYRLFITLRTDIADLEEEIEDAVDNARAIQEFHDGRNDDPFDFDEELEGSLMKRGIQRYHAIDLFIDNIS